MFKCDDLKKRDARKKTNKLPQTEFNLLSYYENEFKSTLATRSFSRNHGSVLEFTELVPSIPSGQLKM